MTKQATKQYHNPIISGFYPDPSICRVGDDYYLVNSSFEYFPAIPIWHSLDLVHWEQIGHAVDRASQNLNLEHVAPSGGVQACTIRYHDGTFYITSTCVGRTWPSLDYNFIVTAKDPRGPWSEVHYIKNAPGIDSSLFFDEDGRAYFHANVQKEDPHARPDAEIWCQEIDLNTFELIGQRHALWDGCGGIYPEGPHIYKRNGYYYLLIAEGGTGHWHTVTMARSQHIFGPYEPSPRNPLLSHKHLHRSYPIQTVGHADLVQTQNGEWFAVCLGTRPKGELQPIEFVSYSSGGYYSNLGRETFLVPVIWEDDYSPLMSPFTGRVEQTYPFPTLEEHRKEKEVSKSTFEYEKLELFFNSIRNEEHDFYSLTNPRGYLTLKLLEGRLTADESVSFIGRRQRSWNFFASTKLHITLNENQEEAGLTVYYNYNAHMRLCLMRCNDQTVLQLITRFNGVDTLVEQCVVESDEIYLSVHGMDHDYTFNYAINQGEYKQIGTVLDGKILSSYASGGHTGAYIGMYASSNGQVSTNVARFSYFEYNDEEMTNQ